MKKPLDNFNACDDFFVLVVKCHILTAAMEMLEMEDVNSVPSKIYVADPENLWMLTAEERKKLLLTVSMDIFDNYMDISFHKTLTDDPKSADQVHIYAKRIFSLGCFYMEYSDAIREGDGNRVLRCWRYLLPMFVSSGRKNYALESLNLLVQHDFTLSPRQAAELIWSRFVNIKGLKGTNIPNDLHMEHLNRLVKISIRGLGANKTANSIMRVSKVLHVLSPVVNNFDSENEVAKESGRHGKASEEKDTKILLKELTSVFKILPNRVHNFFPNPRHPLHAHSTANLKEWIVHHLKV